MLFKRVEDQDW